MGVGRLVVGDWWWAMTGGRWAKGVRTVCTRELALLTEESDWLETSNGSTMILAL
ncbi:hypothetical protein JAAARDRAFT_34561 [Jaapia argillacea MUCL 33604]|uniref:Uncharacterized protein n=1 Tax=Jaapia argillacea MUCL 33604 TaxID=933084 RepID=A0A067Q7Y7_9AGAM|nr:hypothetical protein JAAARDRAFT_34561 [Jaapia argillacea MUCL 33604]